MPRILLSEIFAAVHGWAGAERLLITPLAPEDTGLPMMVILAVRSVYLHGPQIGVCERVPRLGLNKMVNVSVSDEPRVVSGGGLSKQELRLVRGWILLNLEVLARYWNGGMLRDDLMAAIRPVGKARGRK